MVLALSEAQYCHTEQPIKNATGGRFDADNIKYVAVLCSFLPLSLPPFHSEKRQSVLQVFPIPKR